MKFTQEEQDELAEARKNPQLTLRPTIPALEELLYIPHPVLDFGSLTLVDYQGDESMIAASARVSYGKGTRQVQGNKGLLRYLMRHSHATPYEMSSLVFRIEMPIVVMRQLVRHRTAKLNEYSGRYSVMPTEFYVPEKDRLGVQSQQNKQGTGSGLTDDQAAEVLNLLIADAQATFDNYNKLLEDFDLARELARINLPLSTYTKIYWKMDIRNLLHFLGLRMDTHAQWEIRQYANVMGDIVQKGFPNVWDAFNDYHPKRDAILFTRQELELLSAAMDRTLRKDIGTIVQELDLSKRELSEFAAKLRKADMLKSLLALSEYLVTRE